MEKITYAFFVAILIIAFTIPFSFAPLEQTKIYVDPPTIIDSGISPGQTITIGIMVANVTDLYTWQIKINFTASVLNCTAALVPTENVFKGKSYYAPSPVIDNVQGYVTIGATLIGSVPGVSVTTGKLAEISFSVKVRGATGLYFSPYGGDTYLYNSGWTVIPASTKGGFFSNRFPGDVNGDGVVNVVDAAGVSAHWYPGPPIGPLGYNPNFDINGDAIVGIQDAASVSANWGKTYP